MSKKKRIINIIVIILLLIALTGGLLYLKRVDQYRNAVTEITLSNVDISMVPDGEYEGECDVQMIYVKVRVKVQDGKLTQIDLLEHRNGRGAPAEPITGTMIREQKIDVDAISGATNSSIVIKKAVDNALIQGVQK